MDINNLIKKNIHLNYQRILNSFNEDFSLNQENIQLWIDSQHTNFRKAVCTCLAKNTHYISFESTLNYIDIAIKQYLENLEIDINSINHIIYIFDDTKKLHGGSFLMFAIITYMKLLENGVLDKNILFSNNIEYNTNDQYIITDDFAYSGSQLSDILYSIDKERKDKGKLNLNIILSGCSSIASTYIQKPQNKKYIIDKLKYGQDKLIADRLKKKGLKIDDFKVNKYYEDDYIFPFKYYYGIIIDSFDKLQEEDKLKITLNNKTYSSELIYDGLLYFFRPLLTKKVPISVYLSHKIADYVSSISDIIKYGPVIPLNYNLNFVEFINNIIEDDKFDGGNNVDKDMINNIDMNLKDKYTEIINIENEDIEGIINQEEQLQLIPCINNCEKEQLNISSYYGIVLYHNNILLNLKLDTEQINILENYYNFDLIEFQKTANYLEKNKIRCPYSLYKQKDFFVNGGYKKSLTKNKKRNFKKKHTHKKEKKLKKSLTKKRTNLKKKV